MPQKYPENIDNIESFYRSEHLDSTSELADDGVYRLISDRMVVVNKSARNKRRKTRILFASIAANIALLITVVFFSFKHSPVVESADSNDKDSLDHTKPQDLHITHPVPGQ